MLQSRVQWLIAVATAAFPAVCHFQHPHPRTHTHTHSPRRSSHSWLRCWSPNELLTLFLSGLQIDAAVHHWGRTGQKEWILWCVLVEQASVSQGHRLLLHLLLATVNGQRCTGKAETIRHLSFQPDLLLVFSPTSRTIYTLKKNKEDLFNTLKFLTF